MKDILQIAIHGLIYGSSYWDIEVDSTTNSHVNAALKAGYSIFTCDRLGRAKSSKLDAYEIVQARLELNTLRPLTIMARNGDLVALARKQKATLPKIKASQATIPGCPH